MSKHFHLIISILFVFIVSLNAQEIETLTFFDKFDVGTNPNKVETILPKIERLNSERRGNIIANISPDIPDSMQICINVAVTNWRNYLDNNATVILDFKYQDITDNYDVGTEVSYWSDLENQTTYPLCLAKYLGKYTEVDTPAAIIYINRNTKWDCGYSNKVTSGTNNLTYAIFRSIAHTLGFGSSVKNREGTQGITFNSIYGYSVFDRLVFTPTKRLEEVPNTRRENKELKDFCLSNSGPVYVMNGGTDYQLYAPATGFESYRSLQYFNDKNSLMSYDLQSGEKYLRVDNRTLDILHAIGWNIQDQSNLKIKSENIEENGIASGYKSYDFKVENYSGHSISQPQWSYTLPLKDGGEDIIATSGSSTFTIPIVEDKNKYDINVDGDINGLITFKCLLNGKETSTLYNITLELKPQIISYSEIIKTIDETKTSYSIDFTVHYTGKNYLRAGTREEYSPSLIMQTIEEPYVAHVHKSSINIFNYAWVILSVKNEYGEDEVIITLEGTESSSGINNSPTGMQQPPNDFIDASLIKVYSKGGAYITQITDITALKNLDRDIYMLQLYNKDNICFKTTKYINL